MDLDQGKLFIGGISWETTEERMKEYFGKYGEVVQSVIMKDKVTNRPRGFGFVAFSDPSVLDRVLQDQHVLDGRTVEAKRAMSREEHQNSARSAKTSSGRNMGGGGSGGYIKTKKIFVGGLPPTITEEGFRQYFETYGAVTDVVVMYDQSTQRPRGFGFITFDSEDAVDRVLHKNFHDLNGKSVEVKRALPRDSNPNVGGGGGGRSSGGGSLQSYGGPHANTGAYDGRMDTNRYMQPQAGVGYPGYGGPGYGYGAVGGMGYGGYSMGGYAAGNPGYGAPAFGNPNASAGGFASAPAGVPRSPWANSVAAAAAAYGSAGHGGNAGYESAGSWVAPGGAGPGVPPTAQSPSGAGYTNQGYGYGGYVTTDGSHGNQGGGYGAAGGRGGSAGPPGSVGASGGQQVGPASGYMGGGYSDANGGSRYPNSWRSDPSQGAGYGAGLVNGPPGGQASYGGYGAGQPRQPQQQ